MMHYYKRNIGDYAKKAGRLSMLEHGAYTLLMDAIYDREVFPTLEDALDWTWARDEAEVAAVKFVLSKFFELQEDGRYIQKRIHDELSDYKAKAETNARIAKEREAKRKSKNDSSRTVHEACEENHEPSPNHKPITNNHKPLTNIYEKEGQELVEQDSRFNLSLNDVNAKLQMGGLKPITQDELQSLLVKLQSSYGHKTQMVKNQILGKAFEWIERQQKTPLQQPTSKTANTLAEQRAAMEQKQGQLIDVTGDSKKPLVIEGVGHA